jgi:DNA transposition AAA+ family ATPase
MNLELKNRIVETIKSRRTNFSGSDAKFAISLGISAAQYSRINKGDTEKVLSDGNWISIARKLEVPLTESPQWNVATTPIYTFVTAQIEMCQKESGSLLLCDNADIGKTFTARYYCKTHTNAVYIDCSQVKARYKLIKQIAKEFGVSCNGAYSDIKADLEYYIKTLIQPDVILDEAGDLEYSAFLELKSLWNATENCCGWYMMGANGLAKKINIGIEYKKVGYEEIFSRYGDKFQKRMPENSTELKTMRDNIVAIIAKANADPDMNIQKLVHSANGSPRRLQMQIKKMRMLKNNG